MLAYCFPLSIELYHISYYGNIDKSVKNFPLFDIPFYGNIVYNNSVRRARETKKPPTRKEVRQ
jgi:hypothetical protein